MRIFILIFTLIVIQTAIAKENDVLGSPKIMVVIPEHHIHHEVREPVQQRVPDPAGETEIIKNFIEAGYIVIDPKISGKIRQNEEVRAALSGNHRLAAEIGMKFGADIIIIGEAFSENVAQVINGFQSCRARLEAKAISTEDAQIIVAGSEYASGADLTENTAGKKALQKAGDKISKIFISEIKSNWMKLTSKPNSFIVSIVGANFSDLKELELNIKNASKQIERISLVTYEKNIASYEISCFFSIRELSETIITLKSPHKLELTNFSEKQLTLLYEK